MQVFDYKVAFTPMHLVFQELGSHHYDLDFKLLGENNNVITPKIFFLQLMNKKNEYL